MYMKPRDKNMVSPYETASLEQKKSPCRHVLSSVGLASDTRPRINLHVYATVTSSTSPGNCHRVAISSNYEGP